MIRIAPVAATLAAGFLATLPAPVRAAESYDACTGFIDSLPAVISTQGAWCMRGDLSTAIDSGAAISIDANNVTIDCNGFKLGGLAAGPLTHARGIQSAAMNSTVRNCNVRGFAIGINLGGASPVVEDNRLDGIYQFGIAAGGVNGLVQRNQLTDIGDNRSTTVGIYASGKVVGNNIHEVSTLAEGGEVIGILVWLDGGVIQDNHISGLRDYGQGTAIGIRTQSSAVLIRDNSVMNSNDSTVAVSADFSGARVFCIDNVASVNARPAFVNCGLEQGNLVLPVAP